jgi:hypothetical protein
MYTNELGIEDHANEHVRYNGVFQGVFMYLAPRLLSDL